MNQKLAYETIFLTHSVIGSICDQILILTNRQVGLVGLKRLVSDV